MKGVPPTSCQIPPTSGYSDWLKCDIIFLIVDVYVWYGAWSVTTAQFVPNDTCGCGLGDASLCSGRLRSLDTNSHLFTHPHNAVTGLSLHRKMVEYILQLEGNLMGCDFIKKN